MEQAKLRGMGWEHDLPDFRDYTVATPAVAAVLAKSRPLAAAAQTMPSSVDLRAWCSPVEDQGDLGSCTANAGVGLLEYFERRAFGNHLDGSRLFLYKVTRDLLGWQGDQGAYLRTTMQAMVMLGVPPEQYWPYNTPQFDDEPPAFCYSLGQDYKTVVYFRLDPPTSTPTQVKDAIRTQLAAGLPSMFGFTAFSSFPRVGDGKVDIPFPQPGDSVLGGHAVVAVGYDDARMIGTDRGALLIRNSWGPDWGDKGYGWMPYAYVERALADDFWSLVRADFVDTDLFK